MKLQQSDEEKRKQAIPTPRQNKITDSIEEILIEETSWSPPGKDKFHVSNPGWCPTSDFFERLTGINGSATNGFMLKGTAFHHYLEHKKPLEPVLEDAIYEKRIQETFESEAGEFVVSGRADVIVPDLGGDSVVYDFKFSSSDPNKKSGSINSYMLQANMYAELLGTDRFGLIFIPSNYKEVKGNVYTLEGEPDDLFLDYALDHMRSVHEKLHKLDHIESGELIKSIKNKGLEPKDVRDKITPEFENHESPVHYYECDGCRFGSDGIEICAHDKD